MPKFGGVLVMTSICCASKRDRSNCSCKSGGYLERVDGHSAVRLTSQILALSAGYKPEHHMAEGAMPILQQLQQRIRCPHTFATCEGEMMVIQATTRHDNPFVFDCGRTGLRLPLLTTAIDSVYLAYCTSEEREAIIARLGVATTHEGIDGLIAMPEFRDVEIVCDATSAGAHKRNNELVQAAGKRMAATCLR